ncbi:MAG: 30S ribosomal protein S5 [Patescibacteria group bacterium]
MTNEPEVQPAAAPTENAPVESTLLVEAPRGPARRGGGRGGDRGGGRGGGRGGDRGRGGRAPRRDAPKSEFDQKIIQLRRVSRVVAGGRRFSFSATVVAGDRKGRVGVGIGKGGDTALAVDKAFRDAKRKMIRVRTTEGMSIAHEVTAKNSSGIVEIRPAPDRGIVAGSSVKVVLELAGLKDLTSKILSGSKNKLNIARAAIDALQKLKK